MEKTKLFQENEYCYFEAGLQFENGKFQRNIILTVDDWAAFFSAHKDKGVFTTAFRYKDKNIREGSMIGHFYLDFDEVNVEKNLRYVREDVIRCVSALKSIYQIPTEYIRLYFSGGKGIHLIVPYEVFSIEPNEKLHEIFRLMAKDFASMTRNKTIDTKIYDRVRLLRVPNSRHPKTNLYKIPITIQELIQYDYEELKALAQSPRKATKKAVKPIQRAKEMLMYYQKEVELESKRLQGNKGERKITYTPPCIEHLLANETKEGKRNLTGTAICSHFYQLGMSEEEAYEALKQWNETKCNPPMPDRHIRTITRSIYKGGYTYGCRTLADLSECSQACKYYRK